jgi:hypothetical protein
MDYAMKHKRMAATSFEYIEVFYSWAPTLDLKLQVRMQCFDDWLAAQQKKKLTT